jgi:hypothetical protein
MPSGLEYTPKRARAAWCASAWPGERPEDVGVAGDWRTRDGRRTSAQPGESALELLWLAYHLLWSSDGGWRWFWACGRGRALGPWSNRVVLGRFGPLHGHEWWNKRKVAQKHDRAAQSSPHPSKKSSPHMLCDWRTFGSVGGECWHSVFGLVP